ncbi:hypothetical protein [Paraburkholderia lycopersici]|uniref:Uncharacterized protein n=1 Tax=Paraburkholderia lycopersici TaxID=416944 RepID=A0A1G6M3C0_9BURK|nr:hypothetical protein [Paraburkholderia lycopersici]SDC49475.1 hypothetical protein SAMN05421548_107106 [Paraburkholderia lycopersici]
MKGYFTFDCTLPTGGPIRNFHFLFKPPGKPNESHLADAIDNGMKTVAAPDVMAIVCTAEEADAIKDGFRQQPMLKQAAERTSTKVCLCICTFEHGGTIRLFHQVTNKIAGLKTILKGQTAAIRAAGLSKLFAAPHVLVNAPPGFTFVKPSQKRSQHFLRAEEALTEVESVQFLAFSLLQRLKERADVCHGHLDVIYIDSMGIASVAYALRDMYCAMYDAPQPRVVSFHSHDGLNEIDVPLFGTSFCIISASSSLNLERDWQARTQCHRAEVVTLLTLQGTKGAENALFALPQPNGEEEGTTAEHLRDLPIVGERFAPAEMQPKKVLLRGNHKPTDAESFCKAFTATGRLSVQGMSGGSDTVRPIYLDGTNLTATDGFDKYLGETLNQYTPASVAAIIHQHDDASLALANECAQRLRTVMQRASALPVIGEQDISPEGGQFGRYSGLLIVAAVIGRGTKLLSISRDLRDLHEGARTYFVGAQIAETSNQILVLKQNLEYSATKASIQIRRFRQIAGGARLADSFESESRLMQNVGSAFGESYKIRLSRIRGSIGGMTGNAFLGLDAYLTEPMKLRRDFAFWSFKYDENNAGNAASVFAMVGAILQNAREDKALKASMSLSTDAFQQVILDPENFTRYNDGVIQAAMLRCAVPGELDYSKETDSSQFMLDLLISIFEQHDRRQGEAAAEFALALFTKKLRLRTEHHDVLTKHMSERLASETPRLRLIRVLLGIDSMPDKDGLPLGF